MSKGPGRDELAMFFLLSVKLEMVFINVIGISALYFYILEGK